MKKIHKYPLGVIGNCSYLAYIDEQTCIKWLCMPNFDSSFVFGSLLDSEKGGEFSILPTESDFTSNQYYKGNTNVLCTEIHTKNGSYKVTDFAPRFVQFERHFRPLMLFRKIEPLSGRPSIKITCKPVGGYGSIQPQIYKGSNHLRFQGIGENVRLTTNVSLNHILNNNSIVLSETIYLAFTSEISLESGLEETCNTFLEKTILYWNNWIETTSIPYMFQKEIIRSSLILKLHQYEDTGGIIASGSMALPESDEEGRNWDYRYCWMRDSYYSLNALNHLGHFEESKKYFNYIENILNTEKHLIQPLYGIDGRKEITEQILPLKGYLDRNAPVRLGNAAYQHIQNDVYGQLLISLLPLYTDERLQNGNREHSPIIIHRLLNIIEEVFEMPDAGLWEFRNKQQLHCYTYLFHWAGSHAALKIAIKLNDAGLKQKALFMIQKSAEKIEMCFDEKQGAYTQAIGNPNLDASGLKLITMGYLEPKDDKTIKHLSALENHLKTEEGFFFRYKHADDFGEPNNTFMICSFWYAEALVCVNRCEEAKTLLEKLIQSGNHLGIFSEDVGRDGSQWGNFPQTYSHVGLMNTVFRLARKLDIPGFLNV